MNRNSINSYFLILFAVIVSSCVLSSGPKQTLRARNGMVVSSEPNSSQAGIQILKKGGNAVDAAVAVGFALAVTFPQAGNIGGGGFMVIRFSDGTTTTLDYREKAPAKAWKEMFLDGKGNYVPEKSQEGYLSCGVPGSVAGMLLAQKKYGKLTREQVLQPAIKLAQEGFMINKPFAEDLNFALKNFRKYPGTRKTCSRDGKPYKQGEMFIQTELAKTLRRIAQKGTEGFYKGETARLIIAEMNRGKGLITFDDLFDYQAIERPALIGNYRGYEIISMGPPSSGGILLIQLLNLLEKYDISSMGRVSVPTVSVMAEAMKLAYADRAEFLGDPDFVKVPVKDLISKTYADERRALIDPLVPKPSNEVSPGTIPAEREETTHYSVIDRWGNTVSTTTTLNGSFGSGIVVEGAGFFLNNEMDDFSAKPGAPNMYGVIGKEANAIHPHKRMLSSMTPTIVLRNHQPFLVLGSPGGSTIITTVLEVILNIIDHHMDLLEAVDAPRIHHQWLPDTLRYERSALTQEVQRELVRRGFDLSERQGSQGRVEAIMIDSTKGWYYGASDRRGYGKAAGY